MGTGELEHELLLAETELHDRTAEGAPADVLEVLRARVATLQQQLAVEAPKPGTVGALSVGTWAPLPLYADAPPEQAKTDASDGGPRGGETPAAEHVDDPELANRIRGELLGPTSGPFKRWRLRQLRSQCAPGTMSERLLQAALASVGAAEGTFAHHAPLPALEVPLLGSLAPFPLPEEIPSAGDGLTRSERLALQALREVAPASRPLLGIDQILANTDLEQEPLSRSELQAALARLSQFARARFPLVEVDAVPPTRTRLTGYGESFLEGRLALPLLLIDGFAGHLTNIPAHHPIELLRSACYVLIGSGLRPREGPTGVVRDLMHAGTLVGPELEHPGILRRSGIWELWVRGSGMLNVEASLVEERETAGPRARLVVTEFPSRRYVDSFLAELTRRRAHLDFPGLIDVRDESTPTDSGRVVLTVEDVCFLGMTRRQLERAQLLQWRRAYDFTVLDEHGAPRRLSLDELLEAHLRWRRDVINRDRPRTLERLVREEHAAEALHVAVVLREAVLEVLRGAATDDEATEALTRFVEPAHRELLAALPHRPSHDYGRGFTPEQARVVARARRLHARTPAETLTEWERARAAVAEERVKLESNDAAIDAVLAELREAEQSLGLVPRRTVVRGD